MDSGKKIGKFYCSRCKAIHADATLRFCNDCGGRLVPVDEPRRNAGNTGSLSNILTRGEQEEAVTGPMDGADEAPTALLDAAQVETVAAAPRASTAPLSDPLSPKQKETTELSTGDLVSVSSATPQETSVNLSTGPLKFEALGPQAQLTPEQLARLASTGELKLLLGKKISDRFLVSELLAGGLGRASYIAVDLQTNGKVLVQMFPGEAFDARPESQMYGEALRHTARFRDEDFAVVLGSGRLPDGRVVIISEYVEGNSIAQVIGFAGAFDTHRAARLVRKIADAMNEAHQYGIVHGSLRAENVVLLRPEDLQDKIKIIGLGITLADGEALSAGIPTAADDAHDLAVIAYQMLTGRNPFPGGGSGNLGTVVPVRSIRAELPQQVEYVLNKALSRISAERYQDVRDFGDAFYAALTGGTVPAPKTVRPEPEAQDADGVRSERIQVRELFAKEPEREVAPKKEEFEDELFVDERQGTSNFKKILGFAFAVVVVLAVVFGIYYVYNSQRPASNPGPGAPAIEVKVPDDAPIVQRKLDKPADAEGFTNSSKGLSGELQRGFVPFSVFYPKSFEQVPSKTNFLDVAERTEDGTLKEKFLVTRYPSEGMFSKDKLNFTKLAEGSNSDLRGILGQGYRPISQSEVTLQDGRIKAYEVKFEFSGQFEGKQTQMWGRRLWIPIQKSDAKNGLVVTLLATSLSQNVKSADDLGKSGALKMMLDSLEPGF